MSKTVNPLAEYFDTVIMLTWSNWKSEPRSNRYHYTTRFSRTLPVLFFQHPHAKRRRISVEATEIGNVDIVNVNCGLSEQDVFDIKQLLASKGVKRPLVWIYDSLNYQPLLDALPMAFRVYHATEDYFTKSVAMQTDSTISASVRRLLLDVDFMVAVSQRVLDGYIEQGGYSGKYILAKNGCDYGFFANLIKKHELARQPGNKNIAIFQGGINSRLDYGLIRHIVQCMPDWEFRFCGYAIESDGWIKVKRFPNVKYFGPLSPEEVGRHMLESTVGIIPFIQDAWIRNSLPLKAFEYVACDLPVVSVPIAALESERYGEHVFAFAESPEHFMHSMRKLAATRYESKSLELRRVVAQEASYDKRFEEVSLALAATRRDLERRKRLLDVALLYDPASSHVGTVREHLDAFDRYSNHRITYIPAANLWGVPVKIKGIGPIDLSIFDVVVIHYSIRISRRHHFNENFAEAVERFHGSKVLFIQDEYDGTEIARAWMDRLRFDVVYTCVPMQEREMVYPSCRFPHAEFLPTLTGYVPENPNLESFSKPIGERTVYIGYRGRILPSVYGLLAHEKYKIGVEVKKRAKTAGLLVDIEVDEESRIYGDSWYQFLGSVRATLGTESGANIFDFDGNIAQKVRQLEAQNPNISFEEVWTKVLSVHEGRIRMNQVSPKIFESIRLRTALILFEGEYSGVVAPDVHYIPLKKDFSNLDLVFEKIKDEKYIKELTDRAYRDIVESGDYSYQAFIKNIDTHFSSRYYRPKAKKMLFGSVYALSDVGEMRQLLPAIPLKLPFGDNPLGCSTALQTISEKILGHSISHGTPASPTPSHKIGIVKRVWRALPVPVKHALRQFAINTLPKIRAISSKNAFMRSVSRSVWKFLPDSIRSKLGALLGRG